MGKFHAFNLAQQLNKYNHLERLLTPYFSKADYSFLRLGENNKSIDFSKVRTNIFPKLFSHFVTRLCLPSQFLNSDYISLLMFDNWAKNQIGSSDLLVAWSGAALESIRIAKSNGVKTVLERGSTHIITQAEILKEEYDQFGCSVTSVNPLTIKRELQEYEETDYISVPSNFAAKSYIRQGVPPSKIIKVPFGVDLNLFKQYQKEDNVFRLIHCGSITLRKGVQYLIKAFSEINLPNSELWLVGNIDNDFKKLFPQYFNLPNIKFKGRQKQSLLPWFYSQCDVFSLVSIEEGLPLVILQAMACGLPVVCTENTGAEELIIDGEEGYIILPRNMEAIKEKIVYLYDNPEARNEMGKKSKKKVEENFTWDDYGKKIISEYKKVL